MAPGVGTKPPVGGGGMPGVPDAPVGEGGSGEVNRCAGRAVGIATIPGVGGDTEVAIGGDDSRDPAEAIRRNK